MEVLIRQSTGLGYAVSNAMSSEILAGLGSKALGSEALAREALARRPLVRKVLARERDAGQRGSEILRHREWRARSKERTSLSLDVEIWIA